MKEYTIEVLDNDEFTSLKTKLSLEDAWYWWGRLWELGITAVITHPDDEF